MTSLKRCKNNIGSRNGTLAALTANNMTTLLEQFDCQDELHRCVVEDDGRVAYAYLVRENRMIGDVWLYNQAESPIEPEWRDRIKMPFLNPVSYVNLEAMAPPLKSRDDLAVAWEVGKEGIVTQVSVYLHGRLYGILEPMAKPGWCVAALKDGPLAKCLVGATI